MRENGFLSDSPIATRLGEREREVLEVLWSGGSATVQQVASQLSDPLAYTTVMTTLDRLFKKGLVLREKQERAFVYSPAVSPSALEQNRTAEMVRRFFAGAVTNRDVLLSCFVDAVQHYDGNLLSRLEEKIQLAKNGVPNLVPEEEGKR